jgi:hypothetical protein
MATCALILVRRQSIFTVLKSMIRKAAPVSVNLLSLLDDFRCACSQIIFDEAISIAPKSTDKVRN